MVFFEVNSSKKRANGVKNGEKRSALPAEVVFGRARYAQPFSRFFIDRDFYPAFWLF